MGQNRSSNESGANGNGDATSDAQVNADGLSSRAQSLLAPLRNASHEQTTQEGKLICFHHSSNVELYESDLFLR